MSTISLKVEALVQRRQDLGLTQRELDKLIGVSDCMVAKWEAGHRQPTASSMERWAAALGMRVDLSVASRKRKKVAA